MFLIPDSAYDLKFLSTHSPRGPSKEEMKEGRDAHGVRGHSGSHTSPCIWGAADEQVTHSPRRKEVETAALSSLGDL